MSASNRRFQEPNSVHHLMSRIAHRVYFLKEDECGDFIGMMLRTAEFTGIQIIGWCIMTNHFHLLVHLPLPVVVDEAEIIRRVGVMKGNAGAIALASRLSQLRLGSGTGEAEAQKILDSIRRRMYDIGSFMKILKQWFTEEYNRRNSHVGTLWESEYIDVPIPLAHEDISKVLGYVHLNPIRAAVCTGFDEYRWSSLYAALAGDETARKGLRFVYGEERTFEEIVARHHAVMEELLENEKRRRAAKIARLRAAGYEAPSDPLTSEAYIAQASAHFDEVLAAGVQLAEAKVTYAKSQERRQEIEQKIIEVLQKEKDITRRKIAECLGLPKTTINRYINGLVSRGLIEIGPQV